MRVISSRMRAKIAEIVKNAPRTKLIKNKIEERMKMKAINNSLKQRIAESLRNFD